MAAGAIAVLISAGLGAATGGLSGAALSGGLALGSTLLNRWATKGADNPAKALEIRERQIKSSVVEAQWVVGSPRISGALVRYSEERFPPNTSIEDPEVLWGVPPSEIPPAIRGILSLVGKPWLVCRQIVVLAENSLSVPNDIWVDGRMMPFSENAGKIIVDINVWDAQISALRSRARDLFPDRSPNSNDVNYPLWLDIMQKIANLEREKLFGGWAYPILGEFVVPNVRIFMDYGEDAISVADERCLEIKEALELKVRLIDSESYEQALQDFGTFWDGSKNILEGLSWALIETRAWPQLIVDPNDRSDEFLEWGSNPPKLEMVAEGMSDNPSDVAYWYLTDRCEVKPDDIINYLSDPQSTIPASQEICEELIIIEPVVDGDETSDKDITSYDVYKILYPSAVDNVGNIIPGNLPPLEDREKGLVEWNEIYAGILNAEQRYQSHGIITSSMMLKPDELLQALGEAMGGWIINVSGKYKFIAGSISPPKVIIESENITGQHISWSIGPSLRENINAIRAEISQSKQNNYVQKSLGTVEDSALIEADGYSEWNAGILPFQISEISARRRMNTVLRRLSPGLLVANFSIGKGDNWENWKLTAGDRIEINHIPDGVLNKIFIIESIEPLIDSQLAIVAKEDPDLIYSNSFDLLGPGLVDDRTRTPNDNLGLGVTGLGFWRGVSVSDMDIRLLTDLGRISELNNFYAANFDFTEMILDPNPSDPNNVEMIPIDILVRKQWVIDLQFNSGLKATMIQVDISYRDSKDVKINLSKTYTLTLEERFTGISKRTFIDEMNKVVKWKTKSEVTVTVTGISENNELGKEYSFKVDVPRIDAIGDLTNVDAKPATSGKVLRYDEKQKLWLPTNPIEVVDRLPTNTSEFLPGTIFGVKQVLPPSDGDDNGNGNGDLNGQDPT